MMYGILAVIAMVIFMWAKETKKAMKDPDVIEANELRIPIWRYKKYKEAWDKIQCIYKQYGTDSEKASNLVGGIISHLPNMNEWRRYGDKQLSKTTNEFRELCESVKFDSVRTDIDEEDIVSDAESTKEMADFNILFEEFKSGGQNNRQNKDISSILYKVISQKDVSVRWKEYCSKRSNEVKNRITVPAHFDLSTISGEIVRGKIVDYLFNGIWFSYKVVFEKNIRFDHNTPPKSTHFLYEKDIMDIVASKKKGMICLGRVDMTAILKSKGLA